MLWNAWSILCESAVFILAGFLIAGLIAAILSGSKALRLLGEARPRSVLLATLIGLPLPLCSCSVLPTAVALRRKGASKGATLAFLISTPETSITSILLTYSLLGPLMAIFRPIAACVTAFVAGLAENVSGRRWPAPETPPGDDESESGSGSSACECSGNGSGVDGSREEPPESSHFRDAMRFAFVDLFDDIFVWIVLGIVVAAALQAWLPPEVLSSILGGPLQSMLLMVLIGVPLYVCAESSTPIAAVLIAQGVNPGAALVFLLVGPATNIGSLGVLHRQLGRRTVIVYLVAIIVVAMFMGEVLNKLVADPSAGLTLRTLDEPFIPAWFKTAGAVLFVALGTVSVRRLGYAARLANWLSPRLPFRVSARGVGGVAGIAVVGAYVASGFFTVRPGEVGIVRRFGAIQRADVPPGLHYALPYPVDEVDRVPVSRVYRFEIGLPADPGADAGYGLTVASAEVSNTAESWSLVGDENIADIGFAVHWGAVESDSVSFAYIVADREALVRSVVLGAAREVWAGASINTVFTADRQSREQQIERLAQARLDAYGSGIRIRSFHVLSAHAPPEVHGAFRDVASAVEDRATLIDRARAEEARLIPEARGAAARRIAEERGTATATVLQSAGEAARFLSVQEVYAATPEVTGLRLELETLEKVLPKLRKYLKPPTAQAGELEIWLVQPGATGEIPEWARGK